MVLVLWQIDEQVALLESSYRDSWYFPYELSPKQVSLFYSGGGIGSTGSVTLTEEASSDFYNEAFSYYLWLQIRGFSGHNLTETFYNYLAELSDRTCLIPQTQKRWSHL